MKRFNVLTKVALAVVVSLGMMVAMGAKAQAADKIAITDYDGNPILYVNDVFDDYIGTEAMVFGDEWGLDVYYRDWGVEADYINYSNSYPENFWGKKYIGTYNTPVGTAYVTVYYDIYASEEWDDYDEEWNAYTSAYFDYQALIPINGNREAIVINYYNDGLYYYKPVYTMDAPQFYAANSAALNKLAMSKLSAFANCINAALQ